MPDVATPGDNYDVKSFGGQTVSPVAYVTAPNITPVLRQVLFDLKGRSRRKIDDTQVQRWTGFFAIVSAVSVHVGNTVKCGDTEYEAADITDVTECCDPACEYSV